MIRALARSAGSAAASTSNAASQFSGRAAATSPASGSVDTWASLAGRARSSPGDASVAAKNKKGAPERSANRSTSRDLPTRRRPRGLWHLIGEAKARIVMDYTIDAATGDELLAVKVARDGAAVSVD